ncbi:MAG: hypothetical protein A2736_01645 [Candidatus Yanofskybacteria bacterium RIFCSPHIGHO2_01_FULL_41_27]|uniref:Homing endonuclease LAGLIDADG domain-containing protein n=4 Tax=Parcubacteria group TaxID=1794811 RepID=A0A1F8HVP7_9BACT|nr:MAG: hypothetical protein UU83_C0030G0006 [Candidatus Jorgensenbacteria bacterium GW2011_GWF2_41_8]KKS26865.1 MAG: hypothetical protein UU84_C0014G0005 [Candidatus Yanofskybacteria bacterium GW2011_GWC2_41_9]OGN00043.1 MAG: hypothetical protein A2736_01645 [Candidatus Yanofskybacteria bacterium RIFCSPHIGHO2_01_FULL_41_27]OGN09976.1 MAG: hypothetical protein A3C64_01370 [Candidatus Yanofskybacteria bacterium RIFCSPHIGHO2_02_FULL_41_12]OGN21346.1 MAG: hypothetical protein A3B00_02265 [Candidat
MNNNSKLCGDYVAGFVDGEGCFYLTYRSEMRHERAGSPTYFRWTPYFAINIRADDREILEKIKNLLNCGHIYLLKEGSMAHYIIQNMDDLFKKILPFFNKYPLRAKKRYDFELWSQALKIMYKHKKDKTRCTPAENQKLFAIRENMRAYKSKMTRGYKNSPNH